MSEAVTGAPKALLQLEGLAVSLAAIAAFSHVQGSWLLFAVLFLVPDLSMLGYLAGPRVGAMIYNAMHWYVLPLACMAIGVVSDAALFTAVGLIWVAHIAVDRTLGFGLKYADGFGATHLGKARIRSDI